MRRRVLFPIIAAVFGMLAAALPATAAAPVAPPAQVQGPSIAKIALSQVGVSDTPASTSFSFDCDPYTTMVGPDIPNSNGCGLDSHFNVENENEAWCSDFAKWVWEQAGVTADLNLINAGSSSFYAWGQAQGETMTVDSTSPQVGDAVVFFSPGAVSASRYADHVGIVSAVNSDGTVNLVNGDFLGSTNIGVELDSHVDLSTWSASVWGAGEQWVFVAPPSGPQKPAPSVAISGPRVAVADAAVTLSARASEPQGSISSYLWTFGDGGNASGASVSHVFGNAGLQTVGLTVTSDRGTQTTKTWDLAVAATSSTTVSTPSTSNWYSVTPVSQSLFVATGSGGLAMDTWDGADSSYQALPGTLSAAAGVTALNYPSATDDSMQPHVYSRSTGGQLVQTSQADGTWAGTSLPGQLAADTDIVATTGAPGLPQAADAAPRQCRPGSGTVATTAGEVDPSVYYFDPSGHLSVSSDSASGWASTTLPIAATSHSALALAQLVQGGALEQQLFYLNAQGSLVETVWEDCGWRTSVVVPSWEVSSDTSIATVVARSDGSGTQVLFTGRTGALAAATSSGPSGWKVQNVTGSPAVHGSIVTTTDLLTSGSLREDASYRDTSGNPVFASDSGEGWSTSVLSGQTTGIAGLADAPQYIPPGEVNLPAPAPTIGGQTERLYLLDGDQVEADSASASAPGWTLTQLPGAGAPFSDSIRLYAATDADRQVALAAAQFAGLPASEVTQSLSQAWDDALSGRFLVIAVGPAAASALYFNVCGWANPSGMGAGGTPFGDTSGPAKSWPAAGVFENGLASSSSQSAARAEDLAYFAAHGVLPAGVTDVPAAGSIPYTCSGTA